jgi:hypothetical protein
VAKQINAFSQIPVHEGVHRISSLNLNHTKGAELVPYPVDSRHRHLRGLLSTLSGSTANCTPYWHQGVLMSMYLKHIPGITPIGGPGIEPASSGPCCASVGPVSVCRGCNDANLTRFSTKRKRGKGLSIPDLNVRLVESLSMPHPPSPVDVASRFRRTRKASRRMTLLTRPP